MPDTARAGTHSCAVPDPSLLTACRRPDDANCYHHTDGDHDAWTDVIFEMWSEAPGPAVRHSRLSEFWKVSDFVLENDPLVRGHVYGR